MPIVISNSYSLTALSGLDFMGQICYTIGVFCSIFICSVFNIIMGSMYEKQGDVIIGIGMSCQFYSNCSSRSESYRVVEI